MDERERESKWMRERDKVDIWYCGERKEVLEKESGDLVIWRESGVKMS